MIKSTPQAEKPKTFQRTGKWVEKPRVAEILVCVCGFKYIKARVGQTTCVKCMFKIEAKK